MDSSWALHKILYCLEHSVTVRVPYVQVAIERALLQRSSRWMRGMGLLRLVGAVALTATVLAADTRPNILFIMVRASAPCASSSRAASDERAQQSAHSSRTLSPLSVSLWAVP